MAAGVPTIPDPYSCAVNCSDSCAYYRLCLPPPPPSPAATMNLRSSRLPTQLMALSASLLAVSAVLLLALLFHRLVRRRRRRRRLAQQNAPLAQIDEEGGAVLAAVVEEVGDDEEEVDGDIGVHHVWYIRTKGLDERAIAAVVYDAKKRGALASGDGSCSVCLAEFRDGETLRLLPRCSHAFHRGCIDTWLRAHVNCPLCRAPVQVAAAAAARRGRGESRRRRWRSDGGRRARRPPTGARRQEGRVHGGAAAAGVAGRLVPSAGVEQRALVGDDGARQDQEAAEVLRSNGDGRHRCRPADLVRRRELPELAGEVRPVGRRRRQRRCNGNITVNCQDMTMDSAEKLQFWRGEVGVGLQSFVCHKGR